MGKIAFLFSGQGAQKVGMGRSFYETDPNIARFFDSAQKEHPEILNIMFEGPEDQLKDTANAQPALYLTGLAAALSLSRIGIKADGVAGFSLGELPALAYAKAFEPLTGFKLTCLRGRLMAEASQSYPGSMAAVLKLPHTVVENLCSKIGKLWPVNYNSPGQLVVAGDPSALNILSTAVKTAGGLSLPLAVSGAFHSPFMNEAALKFDASFSQFTTALPSLPVYANLDALPYQNEIKEKLVGQINNPVQWEKLMLNMHADGYTTFIEVGCGNTLAKLTNKILPNAQTYVVNTEQDVENLLKEQSYVASS